MTPCVPSVNNSRNMKIGRWKHWELICWYAGKSAWICVIVKNRGGEMMKVVDGDKKVLLKCTGVSDPVICTKLQKENASAGFKGFLLHLVSIIIRQLTLQSINYLVSIYRSVFILSWRLQTKLYIRWMMCTVFLLPPPLLSCRIAFPLNKSIALQEGQVKAPYLFRE